MTLPTEPIGSFPRPPELLAAIADHAAGRIGQATLEACYDDAVRDTIANLERLGSPVVTDGEQGKPSFATYPLSGLESPATAMVQPAAESIIAAGENGLFFVNGRYSHAFHKGPILASGGGYLGGAYKSEIARTDPSRAEIALGGQVLETIGRIAAERGFAEDAATPLYARIGIASDEGESPQVIEVEVCEPAFVTEIVPEAAGAFTTAVNERLHS